MDSNKMFGIFPRRKYTTKILRKEPNVKNSVMNGVNDNSTDGKNSNNTSSSCTPAITRPYNKRKQKQVNITNVNSSETAIVPAISVTSANNRDPEENSSCNFQLFRCQLVNDQRILFSDQTVKTYELQPIYAEPNIKTLDGVITTPTSSCTVPLVSASEYFTGANNPDNTNFTTVAINDGINNEIITSDIDIIDQDSFETNVANELNEQNDAEFAFGRSVAIMLKKIQNVSARLAVQAKIYQVLGAELRVNI